MTGRATPLKIVPEKHSRSHTGGDILVGTASWTDPGFVEHWYPKSLAAADRLRWYAERFEMVEVNSTFYSVPETRMVERWCQATPDAFTFDVKLHQLLSRHSTAGKMLPPKLRRLAEVDAKGKVRLTPELEQGMIDAFREPLELLRAAGKLGALLLQLSPAFSPRAHELNELSALLDSLGDFPVAIEFRNRNWTTVERRAEMLQFLREHHTSFVAVDAPAGEHFTIMPAEMNEITNPELAYLRLHGRDARAYTTGKTVATRFDYDYDAEEISEIATRAKQLAGGAREAHIVFNNNTRDYAPHAALRLRAALKQIAESPPPSPRTLELF